MVLAQIKKPWPPRLAGTGLLACAVAVIACVALLGYGFGIEPAYGWGAFSRMAVNTAALFLLLSMGLLSWALQMARAENFNFLRWLPVSGAAALMTMIGFVSATNMAELRKATFWRKHTVEVILSAQAFEENLIDLQRGARGYIALEDTNALASFQASLQLEPRQFNQLVELTRDNSAQQQGLKKLSAAMDNVVSYDERMIALCRQLGFKAALNADTNGESRAVFGNARGILKSFSQEERKLLDVRSASEEADSNNAERLLLFGCVIAAVLLVLANYMASREMNQRRRVEIEREKLIGELQRAFAEVKSLSGMIPICAWCKSVRSDEGFWQTVEEYVRTRTDATFSHGMCPDCANKVREEMHES
jgi:CHASE3 domain sensor protein